jgi:hypothetical protein
VKQEFVFSFNLFVCPFLVFGTLLFVCIRCFFISFILRSLVSVIIIAGHLVSLS